MQTNAQLSGEQRTNQPAAHHLKHPKSPQTKNATRWESAWIVCYTSVRIQPNWAKTDYPKLKKPQLNQTLFVIQQTTKVTMCRRKFNNKWTGIFSQHRSLCTTKLNAADFQQKTDCRLTCPTHILREKRPIQNTLPKATRTRNNGNFGHFV